MRLALIVMLTSMTCACTEERTYITVVMPQPDARDAIDGLDVQGDSEIAVVDDDVTIDVDDAIDGPEDVAPEDGADAIHADAVDADAMPDDASDDDAIEDDTSADDTSADDTSDDDASADDASDDDAIGDDAIDDGGAEIVDTSWRDALPTPLSRPLSLFVPTTTNACQPGCVTVNSSTTVNLDLVIDADGGIVLTWLGDLIPPVSVVATIADDGTFSAYYAWDQPAHANVAGITGHFGPGASLTLDGWLFSTYGTAGFMTGWTTYASAREPVTIAL